MVLNHLNLTVTDLPAAVDFLEKYFDMRPLGRRTGKAFLTDDSGFILTLMKGGARNPAAYPANFHIGFFVDSEAKVDALNRRLRDDGYDVAPPARTHAYNFYVAAPGGFTVELGA